MKFRLGNRIEKEQLCKYKLIKLRPSVKADVKTKQKSFLGKKKKFTHFIFVGFLKCVPLACLGAPPPPCIPSSSEILAMLIEYFNQGLVYL